MDVFYVYFCMSNQFLLGEKNNFKNLATRNFVFLLQKSLFGLQANLVWPPTLNVGILITNTTAFTASSSNVLAVRKLCPCHNN